MAIYPADPISDEQFSKWRFDGTYQARQLAILDLIRIATQAFGSGGYDFDLLNQEATQELIRLLLVDLEAKDFSTESTLLLLTAETQFKNKLLQVDSVGTTTYLGYADAGTLTSGATWAVKRIIETGDDVSITWADGDKGFDNIWNDRLTLTYA